MRKMLTLVFAAALFLFTACEYDDSVLTDRVDDLENRVEKLEELCAQMNTNIEAMQTLVNALQNNDYVTSVTPITKDGEIIGYTINFSQSNPITIYHGEDGKDGADGQDGYTPVIGVAQDTDGVYYWTLDGKWLLDEDGNKIKAVGEDGKDGVDGQDGQDGADGQDGQDGADGENGQDGKPGADGKDGITPKLKIEDGFWWVSYDNGQTWKQLDKATGEDGQNGVDGQDGKPGADGKDGDSFFQSVDTTDPDFVVFTLADGTQIKLPTWYAFEQLQRMCNEMNTNITALQTIVNAFENNDYITSITPLMQDGKTIGYTINFSKSGPMTIYHGKDGANGQSGATGHTPVIGVAKDTDGIYYWTVDGEWLLNENGEKVKAEGIDGANGNDGADGQPGVGGQDGVTPQLKIEDRYWWVSYDGGESWTKLGKATGEDGKDGQDGQDGQPGHDGKPGPGGDSMFTNIDASDPNFVTFTLSNGTEIKVPTWFAFEELQKMCNEMNTNITALQTIVNALQNNDYITAISPLMQDGKEIGYTLTFSKNGMVTIYHGKDGKDGADGNNGADGQPGHDGQDGQNGADGHTPVIGVKADTDGVLYWTVDGEWLLDENGQKVKAVGTDGQNGSNGNDGQPGQPGADGQNGNTPELKIENGYWYVRYSQDQEWQKLGKATGENGKDGQPGADGKPGPGGDSMFSNIDTSNPEYVTLTLSNGTVIKVPTWAAFEGLQRLCNEMNSNITALQKVVTALQSNDYVTAVTPLTQDGKTIGYTLTFSKSGSVVIYHGKDGKDGVDGNDGADGQNGQDGQAPVIGVKADPDGVLYWTVDGEWLLDEKGQKVKAVGVDGQNGNNGTDGQPGQNGNTPELKIENGYWYVRYSQDGEWQQLGKATGEDGQDGKPGADGKPGPSGDNMFSNIDTSNPDYVILTLSNGMVINVPTWAAFEKLQTQVNELNTNITALQTIVNALENNDYIKSIETIYENGTAIGYKIVFTKSGEIRIYHGKNGQNGTDGKPGNDGQNGHTPQIGVKLDTDGIYYWTIDGEWLLDENGQKVKAVGSDGTNGNDGADGNNGADGQPGKDGNTPELKIENGYWYVRYGQDGQWQQLGKATGENGADGQDGQPGADGQDGDSFFRSVVKDGNYMVFTLADGTVLRVPLESANLFNKVQSLTYIPEYTDGIADVVTTTDADKGKVTLTFEIRPKEVLTQLDVQWREALRVHAFYTKQRAAVSFIDMPVLEYASDASNGTFTITASGCNLSEAFYGGSQDAMLKLVLSDGNTDITSEKIRIRSSAGTVPDPEPQPMPNVQTFTANGVSFDMVKVEGGTFWMGAQSTDPNGQNYDADAYSKESPVHQVTLSDYSIGKYEVTQELWQVVTGSNPSYFKGDLSRPVEQVSWNDIVNDFLPKLNELLKGRLNGYRFVLPTEAQWEYAARGGSRSQGYRYSGSDNVDDVAWRDGNSGSTTHPVGQKAPNELGLYDMSGNVGEWCSDWYGNYGSGSQTDPAGPSAGSYRVLRGGFWSNFARYCRVSHRDGSDPGDWGSSRGFRLVLVPASVTPPAPDPEPQPMPNVQTFTANGVSFDMVKVEGGTFWMGAQKTDPSGLNYDADAYDYESPVHEMTLSDYSIGKYEVTQELWQAVTGSNPSAFTGDLSRPVEYVNWNDIVNDFLPKLNELLKGQLNGYRFVLPTEAQWEYAARGGNRSKGYKYSGSDNVDDVAWYDGNSGRATHPVGQKAPNELGLYDMSGNVWEWCSDWYGDYSSGSQTDPAGPSTGSGRVLRGGRWNLNARGCRVSYRFGNGPGHRGYYDGFRLVLVPAFN